MTRGKKRTAATVATATAQDTPPIEAVHTTRPAVETSGRKTSDKGEKERVGGVSD